MRNVYFTVNFRSLLKDTNAFVARHLLGLPLDHLSSGTPDVPLPRIPLFFFLIFPSLRIICSKKATRTPTSVIRPPVPPLTSPITSAIAISTPDSDCTNAFRLSQSKHLVCRTYWKFNLSCRKTGLILSALPFNLLLPQCLVWVQTGHSLKSPGPSTISVTHG